MRGSHSRTSRGRELAPRVSRVYSGQIDRLLHPELAEHGHWRAGLHQKAVEVLQGVLELGRGQPGWPQALQSASNRLAIG